MITFNNDDNGYLNWIRNNHNGYVINYAHSPLAEILSLHRAGCSTISIKKKQTTWTANGHIKTCANDREELVKWTKERFGHGPIPCGICKP
ncbi:MAG: hypothetical protein JSV74_01740 [Dehalococcoidia bacterium]|nr:MAG: hypothetical protein JSV74_01740 [Dehalococcoidia bacterium]